MWVLDISGLSRMVHRSRIVPVSHVNDDAEGRASGLPEIRKTIGGLVGRKLTAVLCNGANVEFRAHRLIDDSGERMLIEVVVQLAPLPHFRIAPLQFLSLDKRCSERREQKVIAP